VPGGSRPDRRWAAFVLRLASGARIPRRVPGDLAPVVQRLADRGGTEPALARLARSLGGKPGETQWRAILSRLEEQCAIVYEVRDARRLLARLVPMAAAYRDRARFPRRGRRALSRFACLRRQDGKLVIESPLAFARVEIEPDGIPLLAPILGAVASENGSRALADLLDAAGLLTPVGPAGREAEDADPVLQTWEFADLLFHARSRLGRHDRPAGATFEYLGRLPPLPAVKPVTTRGGIRLPRPDLTRSTRRDPPFTQVVEERRSVRATASEPLSLDELGEFLYRTARVRRQRRATPSLPYETTSRPYPSGGACYPLEVYLAVSRCTGLARGLYHYDPRGHRLHPVAGGEVHIDDLLRDTRQPLGAVPPVLVMLSARFGRITWKYRAMAYSVLLKDVGVLLQTMYLVATAMRLAPCAVGSGDAERSARALGTRFEEESSVGELLLGRLPGARREPR